MPAHTFPDDALQAVLVLADGRCFRGRGAGAPGTAGGEVCFNTSQTGYQEILTDPSYAGQLITFTFPHIGNVGANAEDDEALRPHARGLILRAGITAPSNYRAEMHFDAWLRERGLTALCGVDTRALTRHLRDRGAQNGIIHYPGHAEEVFDDKLFARLRAQACLLLDMAGQDIAGRVSAAAPYAFSAAAGPHVVVVDYGVKRSILKCLAAQGLRLTVVPCRATAAEILALQPEGIFLSNGPGDPAATGVYAVPVIQGLLKTGLPLFGICLGHQLLALALGGRTEKLPFGHRGANHPVRDLETGRVEITSQNHGFHVIPGALPEGAEVTHVSLFDGTNEGLRLKGRPVFSVQYHPEASPGPRDSNHLFARFAAQIAAGRGRKAA